jgi:hypothetical protein
VNVAGSVLKTAAWRRVSEGIEQTGGGLSERYATARDKVEETLDQDRRVFHDREDQARGLAQDAQDRAMWIPADTRQSVAKLLEEQPILIAALGAALGAAVGVALPLSRQEKDMLSGVGAGAVSMGRDVLASATNVLREEAKRANVGGQG